MHAHRTRGNPIAARLVLGFGLIALGAAFAARNLLGHPPASVLLFGPLALLLLALASFARRGWLGFGAHLLLLAALALQLKQMGHLDLLARWWPVGLVWLGLVKVTHSLRPRRAAEAGPDSCPRCS
jgi:hypothetical protein